MSLGRSLAAFLLAAALCGGAAATTTRVGLDDETIFIAVEEALHGARSLAWADITVRSRDGFVTLSGFADTLEDIATAGRLAARVRGVTGVRNKIRLAERPSRG